MRDVGRIAGDPNVVERKNAAAEAHDSTSAPSRFAVAARDLELAQLHRTRAPDEEHAMVTVRGDSRGTCARAGDRQRVVDRELAQGHAQVVGPGRRVDDVTRGAVLDGVTERAIRGCAT